MTNTRLLLGGTAMGLLLLTLWHRKSVERERARAVSEDRVRNNRTAQRAA